MRRTVSRDQPAIRDKTGAIAGQPVDTVELRVEHEKREGRLIFGGGRQCGMVLCTKPATMPDDHAIVPGGTVDTVGAVDGWSGIQIVLLEA